ncbi:MAG TPA: TIGR02996 domain-containing protein [Gemmataceae bacterium]|nr:TIGR02996 domain-containing protein [Gemmataceae bacterium]
MDEDAAFVAAVVADPSDNTLRLIYADWLEERGDPRGEYLRAAVMLDQLEAEQLGPHPEKKRPRRAEIAHLKARMCELLFELGREWFEKIHRGLILYCNRIPAVGSAAECPGRWERLRETALPLSRQCGVCRRAVILCRTGREVDDARWRAQPLVLTAGAELA